MHSLNSEKLEIKYEVFPCSTLYLSVVAHMALSNLLIAKESQTIIFSEHLRAYKINDWILLMVTCSKQFHGWLVRRISVETSNYIL